MFKLELNTDEVNLIANALGELPAKATRGLLNKIEISIAEQVQALQAQQAKSEDTDGK